MITGWRGPWDFFEAGKGRADRGGHSPGGIISPLLLNIACTGLEEPQASE